MKIWIYCCIKKQLLSFWRWSKVTYVRKWGHTAKMKKVLFDCNLQIFRHCKHICINFYTILLGRNVLMFITSMYGNSIIRITISLMFNFFDFAMMYMKPLIYNAQIVLWYHIEKTPLNDSAKNYFWLLPINLICRELLLCMICINNDFIFGWPGQWFEIIARSEFQLRRRTD